GPDFKEVRLKGFALAKELDGTSTVTSTGLDTRDPRLIPPEEVTKNVENFGTYDVYQLGILFYRMMELGQWPWQSGQARTSQTLRPLTNLEGEPGIHDLRQLVATMLAEDFRQRPFPLARLERILIELATA